MVGLDGHPVFHQLDGHIGVPSEKLIHQAPEVRRQVLDEDERHSRVARQVVEESLDGVEPPRRCADPDDVKRGCSLTGSHPPVSPRTIARWASDHGGQAAPVRGQSSRRSAGFFVVRGRQGGATPHPRCARGKLRQPQARQDRWTENPLQRDLDQVHRTGSEPPFTSSSGRSSAATHTTRSGSESGARWPPGILLAAGETSSPSPGSARLTSRTSPAVPESPWARLAYNYYRDRDALLSAVLRERIERAHEASSRRSPPARRGGLSTSALLRVLAVPTPGFDIRSRTSMRILSKRELAQLTDAYPTAAAIPTAVLARRKRGLLQLTSWREAPRAARLRGYEQADLSTCGSSWASCSGVVMRDLQRRHPVAASRDAESAVDVFFDGARR